MDSSLISAFIGIGGTVLGFALSEISNAIKRKSDKKERILLTNLSLRQQAYTKVFVALSKYERYLYNFIDHGNEFIGRKDPTKFAPLEDLTALMNEFESVEIWLHEETIKRFHEFFANSSLLLNLALHCVMQDEVYKISDVSEACRSFIKEIEILKGHIRGVNGIPELDNHSNNVLNKT